MIQKDKQHMVVENRFAIFDYATELRSTTRAKKKTLLHLLLEFFFLFLYVGL